MIRSIPRDSPSRKVRTRWAVALGIGLLGVIAIAQIAGASHPRPRGATPIRVSLVPAYEQCTAPNRTHGAPLAFPSCTPPVQSSNYLTIGTPDANGAPAKSEGHALLKVVPGSPSEVSISLSISDVRCKPGTAASVCAGPNAADGPDYSGQVHLGATVRISDHDNGPNRNEPATVMDIPFEAQFNCVNTPDTTIGGLCNAPPAPCLGCFPANVRPLAVVGMTQVLIVDGGQDGQIATADNTLFMKQGFFVP
jgi:hypothetical protein